MFFYEWMLIAYVKVGGNFVGDFSPVTLLGKIKSWQMYSSSLNYFGMDISAWN